MINRDDLIGRVMGGFRLVDTLGYGAGGVVYRAIAVADPAVERAVKVFMPLAQLSKTQIEQDKKRFLREAAVLKDLHNPHILQVYDVGEDPDLGLPYIVMQLAQRALPSGKLPREQYERYFAQLAETLMYVHDKNIIHRDIKPENILLDDQDNVLLADFGIAKLHRPEMTRLTLTGAAPGTVGYIAPEVQAGHEATQAADVYGLGAVLYVMLTGAQPIQPPQAPHAIDPAISPALSAVTLRALAADPAARYPTIAAFEADFGRAVRGEAFNVPSAPNALTDPFQMAPPGVPYLPLRAPTSFTEHPVWGRANRPPVALLGTIGLLLVAVLVGLLTLRPHTGAPATHGRLAAGGKQTPQPGISPSGGGNQGAAATPTVTGTDVVTPDPGTPLATPTLQPTPTLIPTPTTDPYAPDSAQFISQSASPETVNANQGFTIAFTLKDVGSNSWSDSAGYTLACTNNCMGAGNHGFGGQTITRNNQYTFYIGMTAPATGGGYRTTWELRHNGAAFFQGLYVDVNVPTVDGATFAGQSGYPTVNEGNQANLYFIERNTGSSVWSDGGGYRLVCTANCLGAGSVGLGGQSIAPNQTYQFNFTVTAPNAAGTYRTTWILTHNGSQFGPSMYLDVTVPATWQSVYTSSAPSCTGGGWVYDHNSGGNVFSCTGSGLMMQQGQAYYPEADDFNGGYDDNTLIVKTHVHFNNVNNNTYAGTDATIIVNTPNGACGGVMFEARPNGQWRVQVTNSNCSVTTNGLPAGTVGASADYDLMVVVQNGQIAGYINGSQVFGGFSDPFSGGYTGLMVIDFAWPTAQVYFSNFEIDQLR